MTPNEKELGRGSDDSILPVVVTVGTGLPFVRCVTSVGRRFRIHGGEVLTRRRSATAGESEPKMQWPIGFLRLLANSMDIRLKTIECENGQLPLAKQAGRPTKFNNERADDGTRTRD